MTVAHELSLKAAKAANFVLAVAGTVCTLALIYFLWTGRATSGADFWFFRYLISAMLAVFFFGSIWMRPDYKINVALLCLAGAFALYLVELSLAFTGAGSSVLWGGDIVARKHEIVNIAKTFGVEFDTRTKLEVISALRQKGIDAVPAINPPGLLKNGQHDSRVSEISINSSEILPLAGIADKHTVLCNETGAYAVYDSDERGFHNPKGIWNATHLEIAAVGDSFTQGACVSSDKNFVSLIRGRYPATLNLGMSGNGPLFMLAGIREYLSGLKPRIVLWFYFEGNDLSELAEEAKSRVLLRYLKSGFKQGLASVQPKIDIQLTAFVEREMARELERRHDRGNNKAPSKRIHQAMNIVKLTGLRQRLGWIDRENPSERKRLSELQEANMELFTNVVSQANAAVTEWSGQFYFVYLPSWERYGAPALARSDRDRVLATVENLGISVIDLHKAFQAQRDPLSFFPFRRFGHYNEKGHSLVAEEVLKTISLENNKANAVAALGAGSSE
jgi:hypothetical protein